ncbi:MAG: DoxX family protein [Bacteroidales bacterium]|nr:DoxX family protein [Bacteroidales bacterium]
MKNLATVGRILFALPFAVFGINHFLMLDYYMGMLTSFVPLGGYTIILTGLIMIGVSISIITKKFIRLSTLILAGLLLVFIVTIHIPHLLDGSDRTPILMALLKDISLMGGSLMIAGYCPENEMKNPNE